METGASSTADASGSSLVVHGTDGPMTWYVAGLGPVRPDGRLAPGQPVPGRAPAAPVRKARRYADGDVRMARPKWWR